MTDLTVTAYVVTSIVGELSPLDAVLSWAAWQEACVRDGWDMIAPITDSHAPDFDLPLGKWQVGEHWGWCSSAPRMLTPHYTSIEVRRRPPMLEFARFTTAKTFHSGLGEMKARNSIKAATLTREVSWDVQTSDPDRLAALLSLCRHLGSHTNTGHGEVTHWTLAPGPKDGWKDRPMPSEQGTMQRTRAPYWHGTCRTMMERKAA